MAASLLKQWRLHLGLSGLELLLGRLLPVTLWVSSAAQVYCLLSVPKVQLRWRVLMWILVVSLGKTYVLGSPVACCGFSLYLVALMTISHLEEPREGLPAHFKDLGLSITRFLTKFETLPLFCLLIAVNPLSSFSPFSLFALSSGLQLFLAITKRNIRHTHWKLFSCNLVIGVKALLGQYAVYGDIWLCVVLTVSGVCLLLGDSTNGRSSLLCTGLSLFGAVHLMLFPEVSPTLLSTQLSAIFLSALFLCFVLNPPLWLVFSGYKWLRLLHYGWLLHFLLPVLGLVESESWPYSRRLL